MRDVTVMDLGFLEVLHPLEDAALGVDPRRGQTRAGSVELVGEVCVGP